jgi:nucleotide-binding universal stress UspA family protein
MLNPNNILFPINLDAKNLSYLKEVVDIAKGFKAKIHFLYVNDPQAGYRHPTDHEDAVAIKVQEYVPADQLDAASVVYAIGKGDLAAEVKEYCDKNKIDMIITTHKNRGKLFNALFDSPDQDILDAVKLPFLIIPRD